MARAPSVSYSASIDVISPLMRTASASSDCDVAEISTALPISIPALPRMSRSRSRNTSVNMSGIAIRSTTSALSIAETAAGSRSLPSPLTAAVLGTDAVSGIESALPRGVGLRRHQEGRSRLQAHRVVDAVELRDGAPQRRLAELAVGQPLQRLALDHRSDPAAVDRVRRGVR